MAMNVIMLAGNLASSEEISTRTGTVLCKFSVGYISKGYNGAPDKEHKIPFTAFKDNAAAILAAPVGTRIIVKARAEEDRWTGQDGTERSFLKLIAEHVEILGNTECGSVVPSAGYGTAAPPPPAPRAPAPAPRPPVVQPPAAPAMSDKEFHDSVPF